MNKEEIWKDIPGWEGCYQASTSGNIRVVQFKLDGSLQVIKSLSTKSPTVSFSKYGTLVPINIKRVFLSVFFSDYTKSMYRLIRNDLFNECD